MKTWKSRLRDNYASLDEWKAYSDIYNLASRLGYDSDEAAWADNPMIQGSVNPSDFKVVKASRIPPLSNGATYGYDGEGKRVCTGSRMGRRNSIPHDTGNAKLHLRKLRWVDGDYDAGGAYWGNTGKDSLWRATGESETEQIEIFVRAVSRNQARTEVSKLVPQARFYR